MEWRRNLLKGRENTLESIFVESSGRVLSPLSGNRLHQAHFPGDFE